MGRKRKMTGKRLLSQTNAQIKRLKKEGWREHTSNIRSKKLAEEFEKEQQAKHPDWETLVISENDGWSFYYRR